MRLKGAQPASKESGTKVPARGQLGSVAPAPAPRGPVASLLRLQRAAGNRATGQLIQRCSDGHT